MSHAIVTTTPPGYCASDGKSLPCSRVSGGRGSVASCTSVGYHRTLPYIRVESLRCSPKKAFVCSASSNGHRKNPDFSRQNNFSRGRNKQNEEKDNFDNLGESEPISTKNGSLLSISETPKYQATAAPGPREKEIVELFRKVQAQLRERAAIKEEKKIEALQGKGKDNETVDSLLKLLRKHSVERGKRIHKTNGTGDFMDQHSEPNGINGDRSVNSFNNASPLREESRPNSSSPYRRPVSNFRKRSPVPKVKYQPIYIRPDPVASQIKRENRIETRPDDLDLELEEELDLEPEPKSRPEPNLESLLSNMTILHEEVSTEDENNESETEDHHEEEVEEDEEGTSKEAELVSMKLADLRALAKTRGLKGFSRLKKSELVELLSRN